MSDKLTEARKRTLLKLSTEPRLLAGADLTTSYWLVSKGMAERHRLSHFTITDAGRRALEGVGE